MRRSSRPSRPFRASLFAALVAAATACATTPPPAGPAPSPPTSPAPSSSASSAGSAATDAGEAAPKAARPPRVTLPLCGCALCAPVVSEDACTQDADCAPATPCHAEACVAKAKAKAPTPRTSCTMILRCDSVDANTCGCLEGRCALYPRKK
ncbi:MAG: hypothetical protein IPF92_10230 [Myxococcales bacterium]|nr:hypothetical protein [Myxococcales bacterium]MBL0192877.1 hypothetical protein [Myxococcales bacterium]HQY60290.1 hypothetical protein [Polyangiaceae bacterium]